MTDAFIYICVCVYYISRFKTTQTTYIVCEKENDIYLSKDE